MRDKNEKMAVWIGGAILGGSIGHNFLWAVMGGFMAMFLIHILTKIERKTNREEQ